MHDLPLLVFKSWIHISRFCNQWCHDFKSFCLKSDIAIITVKNVDYNCIIDDISKSEVIDLLENVVLEDPRFI